MGVEQNKETVIRFLKSMETGTDYSLACEDMRWWIPGRGYIDRDQFQVLMGRVKHVLKTPVQVAIRHVTAEADRVAVEFDGHAELADGRAYDNTYHFLYILRDGKILEQREHANSAYAQTLFGPALTEGLGG
jgi:ketosteroid isomerase-like protein